MLREQRNELIELDLLDGMMQWESFLCSCVCKTLSLYILLVDLCPLSIGKGDHPRPTNGSFLTHLKVQCRQTRG